MTLGDVVLAIALSFWLANATLWLALCRVAAVGNAGWADGGSMLAVPSPTAPGHSRVVGGRGHFPSVPSGQVAGCHLQQPSPEARAGRQPAPGVRRSRHNHGVPAKRLHLDSRLVRSRLRSR